MPEAEKTGLSVGFLHSEASSRLCCLSCSVSCGDEGKEK